MFLQLGLIRTRACGAPPISSRTSPSSSPLGSADHPLLRVVLLTVQGTVAGVARHPARCSPGVAPQADPTEPATVPHAACRSAWSNRQGSAEARIQCAELNHASTPVSCASIPFCAQQRKASRIPPPHSGLPLAPWAAAFFKGQRLPETARRGCSVRPDNCPSLRARHLTRPAAPLPENRLFYHLGAGLDHRPGVSVGVPRRWRSRWRTTWRRSAEDFFLGG